MTVRTVSRSGAGQADTSARSRLRRAYAGAPLAGGAAVAGLVAGAVVGLAQSPGYRATTTLIAQAHGSPVLLPTVGALATGNAVVGNVASALGLSADEVRRRVRVSLVPRTALVRVQADAGTALRAQQLAQQEATALEAIGSARLGAGVRIAVVDPATAARRGKPVLADALWGALIGLFAGLALDWGRRLVAAPPQTVSGTETVSPTVPDAPAPEPAAEPAPPPPPSPPPPSPLAALRSGLAAHRDEFGADQVAEWEAYLDAFEAQVVDGALPAHIKGMAEDVFAPLQDRLNREAF